MRIRIRAHAKVNLALRVGSRRDDGLHEVATVMQTVGLADRLVASHRAEETAEGAGEVPVELRVRWAISSGRAFTGLEGGASPGEPPEIPTEENTAWLAAAALAERLRDRGLRLAPLSLHLDKHVPPGTGLGGGSSDAVAALMACASLWCRPGDLPARETLHEIAAGIGADAPFFLVGGTAMATGSGRRIEPLEPLEPTWLALAAPPTPISTAKAYELFDAEGEAGGRNGSREGDDGTPEPPAYRPVLEDDWIGNDLAAVARDRVPEIGRVLEALEELGAGVVGMSGSGSACFGSFSDRRAACRAARRLRARGWWARAATTVDREQHAAGLGWVPE